jgi:hypothetical protein
LTHDSAKKKSKLAKVKDLAVRGTAALVGAPCGPLAGGAAAAVIDAVFDRLVDAHSNAQRERERNAFKYLVAELAVASEIDNGTAGERIREALDRSDPASVDVLVEAIRTMLGTIDPAAIRYVAKLGAGYLAHRKGRTRFFRRAGKMLLDVTADDVASLEAFAGLLETQIPELFEPKFGGVPRIMVQQNVMDVTGGTYVLITLGAGDYGQPQRRIDNVNVLRAILAVQEVGLAPEKTPLHGTVNAAVSYPGDSIEDLARVVGLFGSRKFVP